jgi:transcriptional regulator with AAA-type ATPase domain
VRRERLLAAAARLPLLRAAQLRFVLVGIDVEVRRVATRIGALSLVETPPRDSAAIEVLEGLLDLVHEAEDERDALRRIAEHLLHVLQACSVTIRTAQPPRQVAAAGRPWPSDIGIADGVLDGGAAIVRAGVAPEAAEPVRAGARTIGCLAARWVCGTMPPATRVADTLRIAAAAIAPVLRGFGSTPPQPPGPHADDLLGPGPVAETIRVAIRRAAVSPYPVLIEGESGAGKELVARAVHSRSLRRARRFCAVNCAALTDDLLEAELFGHTRGAFTGAVSERPGLFEEADQGTLFLDEVAELSARAQAKLLRVLQEGEVRRVGENHARKVDARIVAATNRALQSEVDAGRFRADLRFRLDVIRIRIPPLRERPDEVPWLATTLWAEAARRAGTQAVLSSDLVAALSRYDWPGNVRELQNVIAALSVHAPRRGRVPPTLLPPHVAGLAGRQSTNFEEARLEFERRFVRAALARSGGRKAAAAGQLGVSRQGLAKMLKRLGIADP